MPPSTSDAIEASPADTARPERLRVLVVQPSAAGHYLVLYVRHFIREAFARGWDVDLMTAPSAAAHPAYARVVAEAGPRLGTVLHPEPSVSPLPGAAGLLHTQLRTLAAFAAGFRAYRASHGCDVVLLGNLDGCDKALALRGSPFGNTPVTGISIGIRHHHRAQGVRGPATRSDALYDALFRRLLRNPVIRGVATIDPTLPQYVERRRPEGFAKVRHVPDAAHLRLDADRASARARFGIRAGQVAVLIYGALHARKGIAQLLSAVADPSCDRQLCVLTVGRRDPSAEDALHGEAAQRLRDEGRLFECDEFVDDRGEADAFAAADAVWLGYRGFYGMSGVLLQAGTRALPVIASEQGLVGWTAQRHDLGLTIDVESRAAAVDALNRIARDEALRRRFGANGAALAEGHTPQHFAAALCDLVAGRASP